MPPVIRTVIALVLALAVQAQDIDVPTIFAAAARKAAAHDATVAPGADRAKAYPTDARGPAWRTVNIQDWVSGFYPGILWQISAHAKTSGWPDAPTWQARAEAWTLPLTPLGKVTSTHDLGFMVYDSAGLGFQMTGDPRWKALVLEAADSLAKRYVPEARILRSWGAIGDRSKCQVIIDSMMNLELLWWASENGGPRADLQRIVRTHADHVLELFFRPDGSTYHLIELDPATGAVLARKTAQGKAPDSCWSRGLTWAIYGYTYLAEVTGDPRYLDQAVKSAGFYIDHLPPDRIPPSDFNSTLTGLEFQDSSAAPIAASAFYRLARLTRDPALAARLRQVADQTLVALTRAPYYDDTPAQASLLIHGARNYCEDPQNRLTNISLIWGDYYLLEALTHYQGLRAGEKTP